MRVIADLEADGLNPSKIRYRKYRSYYRSWARDKHRSDPRLMMVYNARRRAKAANLPCTIEPGDLVLPTICPVLGIPLEVGGPRGNAPSLDRVNPEHGYTKENCRIISNRANQLKQDNTPETLRALLKYIEDHESSCGFRS